MKTVLVSSLESKKQVQKPWLKNNKQHTLPDQLQDGNISISSGSIIFKKGLSGEAAQVFLHELQK